MSLKSFANRPRTQAIVLAAVVAIAIARIVSTYHVFNQTSDEPAHIDTGMEWLSEGRYTVEVLHPPLARVMTALGPYLAGARFDTSHAPGDAYREMYRQGTRILLTGGRYWRNLSLARAGVLPFLVLATVLIWLWTSRVFGIAAAFWATVCFTILPSILGHAGLATTDFPLAATFALAMFAFVRWIERQSRTTGIAFGAAAAVATLTKFSTLVFFPAAAVLVLVGYWWSHRKKINAQPASSWRSVYRAFGWPLLAYVIVIWAGYRFSVRPLVDPASRPHATVDRFFAPGHPAHEIADRVVETVPLPAPEFFGGINAVRMLAETGRDAFLLGQVRHNGWWYFFPVVLAVKLPVAFSILFVVGAISVTAAFLGSGDWRQLVPMATFAGILLVAMTGDVDIGSRHVLPALPFMAILAGVGVVSLWASARSPAVTKSAAVVLIAWLLVTSIRAHPDYLSYFNALAGHHPEHVAVDSDLDWGQDLNRLGVELDARHISSVTLAYFGSIEPSLLLHASVTPLQPYQRATGWVAISQFLYQMHHREFAWLDAYKPVAHAGRSILLFDIAPLHQGDGRTLPQ